jgi:hypothetical protein
MLFIVSTFVTVVVIMNRPEYYPGNRSGTLKGWGLVGSVIPYSSFLGENPRIPDKIN